MTVATGTGVSSGVAVIPWGWSVLAATLVGVDMAVGRPMVTAVADDSTGNKVTVGVGKGVGVRVEGIREIKMILIANEFAKVSTTLIRFKNRKEWLI